MAIDVLESPINLTKSERVEKVSKDLCEWKIFKSIKNVRIRLEETLLVTKTFQLLKNRNRLNAYRSWIYAAFILFGVLMANKMWSSDNKIETKTPEVNVFISKDAMETLLKVEQELVGALNSYADELQHKVDVIRSGLAQMRKPTEIHNINAEEFLSNPLNSFPMLRRLKTEWKAWEKYLNKHIGKDHIHSIHSRLIDIPNFNLLHALDCFEVLREIYDIQPADWVEGKLHDTKYDKKFSSLDAYTMAFLFNKKTNYTEANDWFEAALNVYEDCEIYSFMNYSRSLIQRSLADNLLNQNITEQSEIVIDDIAETIQSNISNSLNIYNNLSSAVQRCCRGENEVVNSSQLHCYYNSSTNDFVRLAPFKVEELHLDPIVLLYHDIISDGETAELKMISKGRLMRSYTVGGISKVRTSESTWLRFDESHTTSVVKQRIEDMTGLYSKDNALLVGNYSPGGVYKIHKDCLFKCKNDTCDGRLATVLLYLSDVGSGGATVFPKFELSVRPQKGKAVLWYNVKNDMKECDMRTLHSGCPVIVGTKWFAVQWIHFKDQIFRKPCFKNTTDALHGGIHNPKIIEQVVPVPQKASEHEL